MKKWWLKAVLQKFFTLVPGGFKLNYVLQKYVTKAVRLSDDFFETMLTHFNELETYARKNNFSLDNKKIFEIGTGWHPVVPLACFLSGAAHITTLDLNGHLRKENLKVLLEKTLQYHTSGKLWLYVKAKSERLKLLEQVLQEINTLSVNDILIKLNIEQHIMDASKTNFEENHFDLCYSVNVYEHINEAVLPAITAEISRICKVNGLGYHAIGVYDHFVHVDKSISKFNYLKYSSNQWKIIDNAIQPQNRLRLAYFEKLFENNSFKILDRIFHPSEPEEIDKIKLHPDWQGLETIDIPYGTFIIQKQA